MQTISANMGVGIHTGPSELPTPPPDMPFDDEDDDDITGSSFNRVDSGMEGDFEGGLLHSPVSPNPSSAVSLNAVFSKEQQVDEMTGVEWTQRSVSDFEMLTTLGTGTFARVWLVRPRESPPTEEAPLFALKQLKKVDIIRLKQCEHVLNERAILELCRPHPFITHYLCSWQDRNSLYILLEYSPGGEIFGYLRRARRFDFPVTQFYAAEITMILIFLHSNGIVYRDLKPENILLDARGHVKLVDFGFAKVVGDRETYTLCGTPEYLSPEVIQSKGHGKAVDWWALGVLIFEMMVGNPPFWANSPFAIYEKIVAGRLLFPSWLPEETKDIVRRLCTRDLSARLGNTKGGGYQVMQHPFFDGVDWQELESQINPGPIIPQLRYAGDTRYFDQYEPPAAGADDEYSQEMFEKHDESFKDF